MSDLAKYDQSMLKKLGELDKQKSKKDILDGVRPQEKLDKVLLILTDKSGSMGGNMETERKIEVANKILKNELAPNLSGWACGILSFESQVRFEVLPTRDPHAIATVKMNSMGGTSLHLALKVAWDWARHNAKQARFIMLTDGSPTDARTGEILDSVRENCSIPIDTVGIGEKDSYDYDPDFLREISRITGGIFTEAHTIKLLSTAIRELSPTNRPLLGTVK